MKAAPTVVVMATRNKGKVREILRLLDIPDLAVLSLDEAGYDGPMPEEDAETFAGNAAKKALFIAKALSRPALADDSGLCVDALGGGPGVRSARFAGENADDAANNSKLLASLESIPDEKRGANFHCSACLAYPDGETVEAQGRCDGVILREARGDGGFGYDPLFFHPPSGKTFAQLDPETKNRVSHRAAAMIALKKKVWE